MAYQQEIVAVPQLEDIEVESNEQFTESIERATESTKAVVAMVLYEQYDTENRDRGIQRAGQILDAAEGYVELGLPHLALKEIDRLHWDRQQKVDIALPMMSSGYFAKAIILLTSAGVNGIDRRRFIECGQALQEMGNFSEARQAFYYAKSLEDLNSLLEQMGNPESETWQRHFGAQEEELDDDWGHLHDGEVESTAFICDPCIECGECGKYDEDDEEGEGGERDSEELYIPPMVQEESDFAGYESKILIHKDVELDIQTTYVSSIMVRTMMNIRELQTEKEKASE